MKKGLLGVIAITFLCTVLFLSTNARAETQHDMMNMGPMSTLTVDGYILNYSVQTADEHKKMMTDMKIDPAKMKMTPQATHFFSLEMKGADGKVVDNAVVRVKIIDPDQKDQIQWAEFLKEMNHFSCDFNMQKKGKYGVIVLFKTADEKKHIAKFWHELK